MRTPIHKPYNKMKGAMRERGITYANISELLNISTTSVSHKINGHSDFYLSQAKILCCQYDLDFNIFLA